MSYDIYLWDSSRHQPDPATLEDAARMTVELEDARDGVNPKFIEFAEKLVARYPSRDMYKEGDPDAHDSPWLGNPVEEARKHQEALFSITLPMDDRVQLTRFVVDTANASGLTVFDDQLGMAFLPSGRVLPAEKTGMWAQLRQEQDAAPAPVTKAQVRKAVWKVFKPALARFGFKEGNGLLPGPAFVRSFDQLAQYATLSIGGEVGDFVCYLNLLVRSEQIQTVNEGLFGVNETNRQTFHLPMARFAARTNSGLPVNSTTELQGMLDLLKSKGLPILDVARDVKGVDEVLNGATWQSLRGYFTNFCPLSRLTAACLSGNPEFEAVAADLDEHTQKLRDGTREKYLKLLSHLREL